MSTQPSRIDLILINPSWSETVCVLALWSWSTCDIFRMSGLQPECRAVLLCVVLGDGIMFHYCIILLEGPHYELLQSQRRAHTSFM